MPEDAPWRRLLDDPLKEVTRKERRALLGVSVVGVMVAKTGILPTKIEAMGINFVPGDKSFLLLLFAGIISYFLVMFVVYGISDFVVWQKSYHDFVDRLEFEETERQYHVEEAGAKNVVIGIAAVNRPKEAWKSILGKAIPPATVARAFVEFSLPLVVGLFAVVAVLRSALR